jgi:YbbR domain-containing protein
MTGAFATLVTLVRRLAQNWPSKLGALALAFVIWLFVTSSATTTTQRSLVLPLVIEGIDEDEAAVGLPEFVEVSVSGPSARIDRLRPDMLRATLDLNDIDGDFERPVVVQSPQEIRLLRVEPADVIGFVETVARRAFPVVTGVTGSLPEGRLLRVSAEPAQVTAVGRGQVLDTVARVVALAGIAGGEAAPLALDGEGQPVSDVRFEPLTVRVTVTDREALITTEVRVDLATPTATGLVATTPERTTVRVAGPVAALATLERVRATVEPPTGDVAPGRYTLPVRLDLPDGVVALDTLTAVLQFERAPLEP